jgi:hypothetical protein
VTCTCRSCGRLESAIKIACYHYIMKHKVMTVRLDPEEARRAEIVARTDEVSVNEVFRRALLSYFDHKLADADFVERATAMVARDAEIVGCQQ